VSTERHELKMAKKQVDDELELKTASLTELEGMLQKVRKEAAKNTEKAQILAHERERERESIQGTEGGSKEHRKCSNSCS
jgi:hypothetical protein